MFTAATIVAIILVVMGIFAYTDAANFQKKFSTTQSIFVQSQNGTHLNTVILNFNTSEKEIGFQHYEGPPSIEELMKKDTMPEGYYKIFVLEKQAFKNAELEDVPIGAGNLSKNETIRAMYSDTPIEVTVNALVKDTNYTREQLRENLENNFEDEQQVRRYLFGESLMDVFGTNPLNVISGVHEGNILIHPETFMFKSIKLIPFKIFEGADKIAGTNSSEE